MSGHYIDNDEFADAVQECQRLGRPTEKVCRMFRTLAEHVTGSPKFSRYSVHDKEEMVSMSLEKCLRNVKNWKA